MVVSEAVLPASHKTHYRHGFAYLNAFIFLREEDERTSPLVRFAHKETESQRLKGMVQGHTLGSGNGNIPEGCGPPRLEEKGKSRKTFSTGNFSMLAG